ncbi:MAG: DUF92 domain-containing protein [Candidatus Marsarchaeota archaeon]|nr:DUF92 domain-containing protein [Candidatus Marsarchaeota archaeon]MCL5105865.1 DUF92 domain-containing protein [Candidatus Marsarchaeota archaeon]
MAVKTLLTLDFKGAIAALLLGVGLFAFGSRSGNYILSVFFVLSMLLFLLLSAIATKIGTGYKKNLNLYEYKRGVKNVLSNGMAPFAIAALFYLSGSFLFVIGFSSAVAAIAADKFSSEIGVLNGRPSLIFGMKKVKKGTSGGISPLGLAAGLAASIAIMAFSIFYFYFALSAEGAKIFAFAALAILISGFSGTIIDSVFGYFENKGIGTKHTTNFIASLLAGFIGIILFLVFLLL